ncbi:MAG: hypothetical protein ACI9U2_002719 [Bradymonadia bacterium]|jgi:hypothetical protein
MLQGAIIGAIVGIIMTIVINRQKKNGALKVLGELEASGQQAARRALDAMQPAVTKVATSKFQKAIERLAGLAVIEETAALQAELNGLTGAQNILVQLKGIGLLGLAVRADDPSIYARQLRALSDAFDKDGGVLMKLVKRNLRIYANLAEGIAGDALTDETKLQFGNLAPKSSMAGIVMYQARVMAAQANGQSTEAAACFEVVKGQTQAFG